ncbi:MAG: hypothetical protein ACREH9_05190 [Pseudomonadota bacterium]
MARRAIIVDTGPLLTYLAVEYVRERKLTEASDRMLLRDIRSGMPFGESEQEVLRDRFRQDAPAATTHVVVEALRFREHSELAKRAEDFRGFCIGLIAKGAVSEVCCTTSEIEAGEGTRQLARRHGITDAGLVFVAMRRSAVLVTDDRRLRGALPSGGPFEIKTLDEYLRA